MSLLTDLLALLTLPEDAPSLLDAATRARDLAALAQGQRQQALADTATQAAAGVWSAPALLAALSDAAADPLLLSMNRIGFIAARGGACDLDIEYHPLLPPGSPLSPDDVLTAGVLTALAFLDQARKENATELWFAALQAEGRASLHQLQADLYLADAIRAMEALETELRAQVDASDPYAAINIVVHAAIVALYYERQLAWRIEGAYRRFLASFPDDVLTGWQQRAEADPDYESVTSDAFTAIVVHAREALLLHNPSDPAELNRLEQFRPPSAFPPMALAFEPDVVDLPDLPPAAFAKAAKALGQIAAALGTGDDRRARAVAVLRTWEAFAQRGLLDFRALAATLPPCDDESCRGGADPLGIVVQALRGEARYRMGQYEDAYLDLLGAERAARAALGRRTPGADTDPAAWTQAEQDAVARLAQKAGNALLAIGDEEHARLAYDRASQVAVAPLSRAGNLVNQGNLHFLHNSAVGGQGYIELDAAARQEFVLRGPEKLLAAVVGRHAGSLWEAERCYRSALGVLGGVAANLRGYNVLLATCHINLGNVAWAWGRTLALHNAALDEPKVREAVASQLIPPGPDAAACYEAAVTHYEAGLAALGVATRTRRAASSRIPPDVLAPAAAALSSLSEMRYLLAYELLRAADASGSSAVSWPQPPARRSRAAASLDKGLAEAQAFFALIGDDGPALYPDLTWRTHYNLARSYRLLGDAAQAREHFGRAIELVESLRGQLRLEGFQSAFLHDKQEVYEAYMDLLLAEGEAAGDPAKNAAEIFATFERSRARAFLTLLQAANVKTGVPDDVWQEAEALLAQVAACNEAIQSAVAADKQDETKQLLATQQRLADKWVDVQAKIAQLQRTTGPGAPPLTSLADFQAALDADQAFLGLLLGDDASFALLVDSASCRVFRLSPRRAVELLALPVVTYATWNNIEKGPPFREVNVRLTEKLLGPIDDAVGLKAYLSVAHPERSATESSHPERSATESSHPERSATESSHPERSATESKDAPSLKHLIISPDGLLCYLPFDLLLADRAGLAALPETADFPDFIPFYLLSLADLSYTPSASAWLELARLRRTRSAEASQAGLLAVYNVHYDTDDPPLWAVAESLFLKLGAVTSPDIARITAAVKKAWPDLDSVYLRSRTDDDRDEEPARQSTETNFCQVAPSARARVLMFHGHGIFNDRYPSLSGLIFNLGRARSDGGAVAGDRAAIPTADDGFLRVEELFKLDLPGVELTLLAACQTALGAYRRGEGLSALVRAFLYRGSPAVMATLWEVRPDMTGFLLKVFFKMVGENPDADRARLFSQAKRKSIPFVANLCLPYFWAPYVLWGNTGVTQSRQERKA